VRTNKSTRFSFLALVALILVSLACGNTSATKTPKLDTVTLPIASQAVEPTNILEITSAPKSTETLGLLTSTETLQATEILAPQPTSTPTQEPAPGITQPLQVHYIDVGQGDAILIITPDGQTMLIDGGETNTGIVQYLQSKGIQHLNLVVATHPHSDHIGGLVQVLNAIPVDKVITNGQPHTTSVYENFLDAIASAKAEYIEVKRGDTITLSSLVFNVLNPVITTGDINNNSIVLMLVYGKVILLFMGDAQTDAEVSMLASGLIPKVDILKVGHHGSRTASSPAFLAVAKPTIAIYSAGIGNDYGNPHPETIAALQAIGATIYGTDVNGTIIVTSDGSGYSIETVKQGQSQAPPTAQPTTTSELSIKVVSLTSPIAPGQRATLKIQTTPGADCTIAVYYKSGRSQAQGLGPQTAAADGGVTWSWKVGSSTTPGTWRIVVTVTFNGQTISKEISFEVQK
jgi:beta-lactamase superfamily II metal-dependent hydrolase